MSKSYSFGRVTRFHCVVVLHDPTLFWIWRNGGSEEFRVRDDVEIKVFMHLYSPLLFQLLSICFLLKISQVIWSTKCILKNIPLLSEGRIRSCPYEQVLSILVLVSNCKLGWGGVSGAKADCWSLSYTFVAPAALSWSGLLGSLFLNSISLQVWSILTESYSSFCYRKPFLFSLLSSLSNYRSLTQCASMQSYICTTTWCFLLASTLLPTGVPLILFEVDGRYASL